MIKCIVVDDEPLAQLVLENHIMQTGDLKLVKKCSNALEAFDVLSREKIDLMFLDIKMPAVNGMDFIRSLRVPPAVIFTTAFPEYAVLSYELQAVDYLMKPVTYERFKAGMDRFLHVQRPSQSVKEYTFFKVDGKLVRLEHAEIRYAQSIKDYVILATNRGNFIIHITMKALGELLPAPAFMRVHRSFLIGTAHIKSIGRTSVSLENLDVPIGGNYRAEVDVLRRRLRE